MRFHILSIIALIALSITSQVSAEDQFKPIDITDEIEKRFSEIKTSGKPSPAMMKLAGGGRGLKQLQDASSRYSGRGYNSIPSSSEA